MAAARPKLAEDGLYYYGEYTQPDCFGLAWEAPVPGEGGEDCRGCGFEEVCGPRFAETTLTKAVASIGTDVSALAAELEVAPVAVEYGLKKLTKKKPAKKPEPAPEPEEELEEEIEEEEVPPKKKPANKKATKKKATKKKATKKKATKKKTPKKVVEKKTPKKKVTKKKAAKKKVRKEDASKKRPSKAASVKGAKAAAKRKKKSVQTATAQGGVVPFGEHTFMARWERERARNASIAALKINSTLRVERFGQTFKCKVKKGYYLYEGEKYPTLYKAAQAAQDGKGSNYSGPRFWKVGS